MTIPILQRDELGAHRRVTLYGPLAVRDAGLRTELRDAERCLVIVDQMRVLFTDLRVAKQRVTSELRAHHNQVSSWPATN